jgi:hypothetical protein
MLRSEYMGRKAVALAVLTLTVTACTGKGSSASNASSAPSHPASTAPSALVSGRASTPADLSAPGIQIPAGNARFTVQVSNHKIVITGNDWDTIVASSKVESDVGVDFASGFNWTATTRNRFQYLADMIARDDSSQNFDPINIVTAFNNKTAISIVALYNPENHPGTLTGLQARLISQPGETLLGSGDFFATTDSSLFIPAKTIVFTRLAYPLITQPKPINGHLETSSSFHYDSFAPA